jgi:YtkA-like
MYVWHAAAKPIRTQRTRERFVVLAGAAILAAIALSTLTASLNVDLSAPAAIEAGSEWEANLQVKRAGLPVKDAEPMVAITDASGITHLFHASPGARAGTYRVKIVLPEGGQWSYEVRVGERVYERGTVRARWHTIPEGV